LQQTHYPRQPARQASFPAVINGAAPGAGDGLFRRSTLNGMRARFARGEAIFVADDPVTSLYEVISGAVRTFRELADGRRQIVAFHLPGEVFGLEPDDAHWLSAEAIGRTTLRVVRRSAITAEAGRDPAVAAVLQGLAMNGMRQAQVHALLLAKTAEERVGTFLRDLASRSGDDEPMRLPMTRQDIADHLGLTVATVSRMITRLSACAHIQRHASRCIELRDLPALDAMVG